MALTKAHISQISVAALGVAPGGFYTGEFLEMETQLEVAQALATGNLLGAGETDADFALRVAGNVGLEAGDAALIALYNAIAGGDSRAEALVDFVNGQLVAGNEVFAAAVEKAVAYDGVSTDMEELAEVIAADEEEVEAADPLVIEFSDDEEDQSEEENEVDQTVVNIGKAQLDAGTGEISSDFTFTLADQIGADDTFEGQFLSPVMDREAPESTSSSMYIQVLDGFADEQGFGPIERLKLNGVGFHLDGEYVAIVDSPADDTGAIYNATTYEELQAALAARIEELAEGVNLPADADAETYAKLADFVVELGNTFTNINRDGDTVTGTTIVITDLAGGEFNLEDGFAGYSDFGGLHPYGNLNDLRALNSEEASEILQSISTNLELDNVGYGSQGGSIDIGGQSNSDKGIEEFKVTVNNGVWLTSLVSQGAGSNNHLESIVLQAGSDGYFRVGTQANSSVHLADWSSDDGLQDVQQLEASAADSVAINANISEDILSRYEMDDTGAYTADNDEGEINYNLTSGDDVLRLGVDGEVLEQVDTTVSVTTGEGDDQLIFITEDDGCDEPWVVNQQLLDNITLDTGAGDDWVIAHGAGKANILAGTGDDTIRADNSGDRAVFVFNTENTNLDDLQSNSDDSLSLNANSSAQSHRFFNASVVVSFKGFESEAIEIDSTDYMTSNLQINQAIKEAVNADPVLSKLIWAVDNEGNALGIESLIDGDMDLSDLTITITPAAEDDIDEDTLADAAEAYGEDPDTFTYNDLDDADTANDQYETDFATDGGDIDGDSSDAESDNLITAGRGDDVITLGTGGDSNDTLIYTGYNNGNDSIVNFVASEVVLVGGSSESTAQHIFADAETEFTVATTTQGKGDTTGTTAEVFTLKFGDAESTATIEMSVAGVLGLDNTANDVLVVNATAGDSATVIAQALVDALDAYALTAGATIDYTYAVDGNGGVVFTEATPGGVDINEEAILAEFTDNAGAVLTVESTTDGASTGTPAATEVFTVTISAGATQSGEITFNGETIPVLAGDTAQEIVDSIVAGTYADWSVADLGAGVVEFTQTTTTLASVTDITFDDFGGLVTVTPAVSGTNTDMFADDSDLLDFTSYLTSADEFGATLATDLVVTANYTAGNQVKIVDFSDSIELDGGAVDFADLDAATLESILNGTEDADNAFDNLNIDADGIAADGLDQDYILMVQNHENEGEYKVFHLTAEAENDGEFADVNLVGTLDFGAELDFVDQNFVGSSVLV